MEPLLSFATQRLFLPVTENLGYLSPGVSGGASIDDQRDEQTCTGKSSIWLHEDARGSSEPSGRHVGEKFGG